MYQCLRASSITLRCCFQLHFASVFFSFISITALCSQLPIFWPLLPSIPVSLFQRVFVERGLVRWRGWRTAATRVCSIRTRRNLSTEQGSTSISRSRARLVAGKSAAKGEVSVRILEIGVSEHRAVIV